jgi:hypothetical protein
MALKNGDGQCGPTVRLRWADGMAVNPKTYWTFEEGKADQASCRYWKSLSWWRKPLELEIKTLLRGKTEMHFPGQNRYEWNKIRVCMFYIIWLPKTAFELNWPGLWKPTNSSAVDQKCAVRAEWRTVINSQNLPWPTELYQKSGFSCLFRQCRRRRVPLSLLIRVVPGAWCLVPGALIVCHGFASPVISSVCRHCPRFLRNVLLRERSILVLITFYYATILPWRHLGTWGGRKVRMP